MRILILFSFFLVVNLSCTKRRSLDVYSAGNLGGLGDLNSNLTNEIIIRMSDSLCTKQRYCVPDSFKYAQEKIQKSYYYLTNHFYYFESSPKEIYWVTMDGPNYLRKVFDFKMVPSIGGMWRSDFSKSEIDRMKKRIFDGPLKDIDEFANKYLFRKEEIYLDTTCLSIVACF